MSMPWVEAWHEALYGRDGLYVRDAPHAHFSTATSPGLVEVLAEAVVALMRRDELTHVVDIAAGGGELATAVCDLAPDLDVTCVEVRPRPARLSPRIEWIRSPGGAALPDSLHSLRRVLVLAHEWLDNVPCVIAQRTPGSHASTRGSGMTLREVCVAPDGTESLGRPVSAEDLAWAQRWWPEHTPPATAGPPPTAEGRLTVEIPAESRRLSDPQHGAGRVEIGRARDEAWADLCSRVEEGLVVAVDYGHLREARPEGGSLVAYRSGGVVVPVPDGSCDLTAHVAVDSLDHDRLMTQRDLLRELGLSASAPDTALARTDPGGYLHALARRSAVAALIDAGGLGGFWWAIRRLG